MDSNHVERSSLVPVSPMVHAMKPYVFIVDVLEIGNRTWDIYIAGDGEVDIRHALLLPMEKERGMH